MLNKQKNNKGFTLVELLVVIAIIGILAVVAVPSLFKNIEKGKVGELESDISAIRSAALSYYAENSKYPVTTPINKDTVVNEDSEALDVKATNAILKEVESLGFPFKGSYTLSGTEPGKALLTIDLNSNNGVKLSKDAAEKLINDLGKVLIVQTKSNKVYAVDDAKEQDDQSRTNPTTYTLKDEFLGLNYATTTVSGNLTNITEDISKITIELMDGANQ